MSCSHVILGTGAIGRAVGEELVQRGEVFRMVNRSGEMIEPLEGVEIIAADLYDVQNVRAVTEGAAVVYQCAQPRYYQWPEKFPSLQQSIIDGLTGSNTKLVIAENLYMYGPQYSKRMTEDLPYNANTRKGRTRAAMSHSALAAHHAGKVRLAIARGSDFFGPWGVDSTMGGQVFFRLLQGKAAQVIGRTDLPHTHTFTCDFGKALVILGERPEADGQIWHVPNDMPDITQGDIVRMFAREAGVKPKMRSMGKLMLVLGGLFVPEAKETVEMLYEFEQPFVVDSSKFEQTFGMQATPMRTAIRETLAWYRSHTPQGSR